MKFWKPPRHLQGGSLQAVLRHAEFIPHTPGIRRLRHWPSKALGREIAIDIYLPPNYLFAWKRRYPLVVFNDGQDLPYARLAETLQKVWRSHALPHFIAVGVHAGAERSREYGTVRQADYKGRGDKAGAHRDFVLNELFPFIRERFRWSGKPEETAFAGFSLGGLSAFDIAWAHPEVFGAAGVFSGALWWRWAPVNPDDPDACRIMHDIVLHTDGRPNAQRFWFQAGTKDEEEDRNGNGVIDAIDDTLHLIEDIRKKGYKEDQLRYLEMEGGEHNPATWGAAMADFLGWWLNKGH